MLEDVKIINQMAETYREKLKTCQDTMNIYDFEFNRFAQAAGPGLNAPSDEGKKG